MNSQVSASFDALSGSTRCRCITSSLRMVMGVSGFLLHLKSKPAPVSWLTSSCQRASPTNFSPLPRCFHWCIPEWEEPSEAGGQSWMLKSEVFGVNRKVKVELHGVPLCYFAACPRVESGLSAVQKSCAFDSLPEHVTKPDPGLSRPRHLQRFEVQPYKPLQRSWRESAATPRLLSCGVRTMLVTHFANCSQGSQVSLAAGGEDQSVEQHERG